MSKNSIFSHSSNTVKLKYTFINVPFVFLSLVFKVTPPKSQSQIYFASGKQKLYVRIYEFCFFIDVLIIYMAIYCILGGV